MTDLEGIESSVRRVSARLRVLLLDQSPLIVASTLDAAVDAMSRVRRSLVDSATEPRELRAIIDFMEELTAMLTSFVVREPLAR